MWIQPNDKFGAEFIALSQTDKGDGTAGTAVGTSTWTSLGVRPSWVLRRHLKLVAELGVDNVTDPAGGPAQHLTKLTIAPTITLDNGFWSRPELRFYITHAEWNDAAKAAVNPAPTGGLNPVGGTTSGTSVGVQAEAWW